MTKVKVRVAVAIDADGNWSASGWGNENGIQDEAAARDIAIGSTEKDPYKVYWLTAELDIPTIEDSTVFANVEIATEKKN
jgi:hypothetical protein